MTYKGQRWPNIVSWSTHLKMCTWSFQTVEACLNLNCDFIVKSYALLFCVDEFQKSFSDPLKQCLNDDGSNKLKLPSSCGLSNWGFPMKFLLFFFLWMKTNHFIPAQLYGNSIKWFASSKTQCQHFDDSLCPPVSPTCLFIVINSCNFQAAITLEQAVVVCNFLQSKRWDCKKWSRGSSLDLRKCLSNGLKIYIFLKITAVITMCLYYKTITII